MIASFQASQAFRRNPELLRPALEFFVTAPGALGVYAGFNLEDPNEAYIVMIWETIEHHTAFMNDKETYAKAGVATQPCVANVGTMPYHMYLEPIAALAPALNAPITRFSHVTSLHPGFDSDELIDASLELADIFQQETIPGCHGGCVGKALEIDWVTSIYGLDEPQKGSEIWTTHLGVRAAVSKLTEMVAAEKRAQVRFTTYKKYEG